LFRPDVENLSKIIKELGFEDYEEKVLPSISNEGKQKYLIKK
jgi:hypothetical protein